jgi:hypothetical protein
MRFKSGDDEGEGKMLGRTAISTKDGQLHLDLYSDEPARLLVMQEKDKGK